MSEATVSRVLFGQSPKPGVKHFYHTLEALPLTRPRFPTDTWTATQAAQFWVDGYDPEDTNALPPYLVLGVVSRLVLSHWRTHPLFQGLHGVMRDNARPHFMCGGVNDNPSFSDPRLDRNGVVRALQYMYRPQEIEGRSSSMSAIGPLVAASYCLRSSCNDRDGWLSGCIEEKRFNTTCSRNLLVPWASVNWGALACLLPPMRNCLITPSVSVRRARSHITRPMVPVYVADGINSLQRTMPPALLELRLHDVFLEDLAGLLQGLSTERLRYWGLRASSPQSPLFMQHWDDCFTKSCWSFGRREMVYHDRNASYFGLTTPVYDMLVDSQDPSIFGA